MLLSLAMAACTDRPSASPPSPEAAAPPTTASMGAVSLARVTRDEMPGNWYTTGRSFGEDRYSPLSQIDRRNARRLGFAWAYDTQTTRGLEATPVVVDGVMFTSGPWGQVYALDAASGQGIWQFNPEVDGQFAGDACCDIVNRGVAVWEGKVYVGALDGRLIALDATNGSVLWEADTIVEPHRRYTITGAPRVAGSVVVIGNSGAEFDARGYVSAYDVESGELRWRFFTVPGSPDKPREHPEMAVAAATWDPNSRWEVGGGGTVWDGMAYDPGLNLLYVGTGNAAPYAITVRSPSGGDNLFLSSILAINPDTGRLVWHYQTTPGDSWDYTATQNLILADLELEGRIRQVIMQAPKNGFFYVLDRATGELLSAEPYVPINWASHIDMETGKPVLTEAADYFSQPKIQWPTDAGGHNWFPMAFNPGTGLVYIPAQELTGIRVNLHPEGTYQHVPGEITMGVLNFPPIEAVIERFAPFTPYSATELKALAGAAEFPPDREFLRAWDPVRQETAWEVQSEHPQTGGGVLTTAGGIVVQGESTGKLKVYDADNGELLQTIDTGTGIMAAPATYTVNGTQYIAVMAGLGGAGFWEFPPHTAAYDRGNAGRIIALKVDGGKVPMPALMEPTPVPEPPTLNPDAGNVPRGGLLFGKNCAFCHANGERNLLPDLRRLGKGKHQLFEEIVLGGALRQRGMPQFDAILSKQDVSDIQSYLIVEAWRAYEANAAP